MTRKTRKQGGQPTDEAEPAEQAQAAEAPESIETTASVEEQDPLATAQAELAELHEQLHRIAADFDNFRKRVERDRSRDALRVRGIVTAQFLDVLETATQAADASYPDVDAAIAGLVGIQRQLQVVMQALDLEKVDPVGAAFDHRLHEALSAVEREDLENETIIEVVQPGYLLEGELLRPARVVVSRTPQSTIEVETTE